MVSALLAVSLFALALTNLQAQGSSRKTLPPESRAAALVRRMTLEEKISQMQNASTAIARLGIPSYDWWNEALHGVARSGYATVFPQAIGLGATWDGPLVERIGGVISTEARAKYNQAQREKNRAIYYGLTMWSPNINIDRDPRWGRGQETYGEDPFLTGRLGSAFVRGLQGADPQAPVVDATAKHFAVHSGPESLRHSFDARVSAHDMNDTYLPAFRQLVVDAKVNAVMCAYNAVDGKPACANPELLQKILHGQWGFKGYVVSDCAAISDVAEGHRFALDMAHAAAASLRAGTDLSCGKEYAALGDAVRRGLVKEAEIDAALTRLLAARIRLGILDAKPGQTSKFDATPFAENDSPAHSELARDAARASIVLLKNAPGALPLAATVKTLAVVGPNARSLAALEGNYNAVASRPAFPLEALEARTHVAYAQGSALVEGFPVPLPPTAFSTVEQGRTTEGLSAEYYDGAGFTGRPKLRRIDRTIDFDWNGASPATAVSGESFSVRWTGNVAAPAAGTISFGFSFAHCSTCDDAERIRVWLDGKQVYDYDHAATRGRRAPTPRFDLTFADTLPHPIRVEYTHSAPHFGAGLMMNWLPPAAALRAQAVKAAQSSDAVVAFLGLSPELEGEDMPIHVSGFEGGDRTAIELPRVQAELVDALAATGKPLVLVLMSGGAVALGDAERKAGAVLEAWYPGEAGGEAIADTLFGDSNPSGRLPVTFYAATAQLPPFADYAMQGRTYRYFAGKPLYSFGYGLSYARFAYARGAIKEGNLALGEPYVASVDVANVSARAGDEVVECYLIPKNKPQAPLRKLVGFEKIHLSPGEKRTVQIALDARALSLVDEEGKRSVQPGEYEIFLGGAQPGDGAGVSSMFRIEKSIEVAP